MLLRGKPIDGVTEEDLKQLIVDEVCEQRTLDYKADLRFSSEHEKKELLKDMASFANAGGGHLIFGISEDCGKPTEVQGLQVQDQDATWLSIESSVRDGIQPRLSGVTHVWVNLVSGKVVLIIDIPRSFAAPHRVAYKGTNRFFSRGGAGRFEMDVQELRQAFLQESEISERLRDFLAERLARIRSHDISVSFLDRPTAAVHVAPASALSRIQSNVPLDFDEIKRLLWPLYSEGYQFGRPNLEGFLTWNCNADNTWCSYAQIFREGTIESANQLLLAGGGILGIAFEQLILKSAIKYLELQRALGVNPPVFIALSLLNVRGLGMLTGQREPMTGNNIDRDNCLLGTIMIESYDDVKSYDALGRTIRPIFDTLWQACGWECGSWNYDQNGNWRPYK